MMGTFWVGNGVLGWGFVNKRMSVFFFFRGSFGEFFVFFGWVCFLVVWEGGMVVTCSVGNG